jgi:hypothetical protein
MLAAGCEPARLHLGSWVVDAVEFLDRWPGQHHVYIKLRGSDGAIYIVRQDLARDHWQLVHFQVGLLPEAPSAPREEPC